MCELSWVLLVPGTADDVMVQPIGALHLPDWCSAFSKLVVWVLLHLSIDCQPTVLQT
jgi:hypothetical protein